MEPTELMRQAEAKEMLADRFDGYMKNLEMLLDRIKTSSVGDGRIWAGLLLNVLTMTLFESGQRSLASPINVRVPHAIYGRTRYSSGSGLTY